MGSNSKQYRLERDKESETEMSTTAEKVAVMQAAIKGEKTEWRKRGRQDAWATSHDDNLAWNWEANEYRVKPKPREFVIALDADGDVCAARLDSEPFHGTSWSIATKVVRAREILD